MSLEFNTKSEANVLVLESALSEKTRLARLLPNVLGSLSPEALSPGGARPIAPALRVGFDILCRQFVADASLSQLVTNLQRTIASGSPLQYELLCESLVRQEILGLERVQHFIDEPLGKPPRNELAAELEARVLAARK